MKLTAKPSFERDVKKAPAHIHHLVNDVFTTIESAASIKDIPKLKKLKGAQNAYRLRLQDYRLDFYIEGDTLFYPGFFHEKIFITNSHSGRYCYLCGV